VCGLCNNAGGKERSARVAGYTADKSVRLAIHTDGLAVRILNSKGCESRRLWPNLSLLYVLGTAGYLTQCSPCGIYNSRSVRIMKPKGSSQFFHNSLLYTASFPYTRYSEYKSRIGNPVPWVTKRQFLWDVTLCRWVSGSRRFEALYRLHLQRSAVQLILPRPLDTEGGKMILRNAMKHSPNDIVSPPTTTEPTAASLLKRHT
jgi:hypothetical protein